MRKTVLATVLVLAACSHTTPALAGTSEHTLELTFIDAPILQDAAPIPACIVGMPFAGVFVITAPCSKVADDMVPKYKKAHPDKAVIASINGISLNGV